MMYKGLIVKVLCLLVWVSSSMASESLDKAGAYFEKGKFRKAVRYAQKVWDKEPANIKAGILLAESYSEIGKVRSAVQTYQRLIQYYPNNVDLVFRMGLVYNKFDFHRNAVETYQTIVDDYPDHVRARYRLGLSLAWCMDLSKAFDVYQILKTKDKKLAADLLEYIQTNK